MNTEPKQEEVPIKEEKAVALDVPSAADIATRDFIDLLPKFNTTIKSLGKKSAQRVLKSIMEYPLENPQPKLLSFEERTAFYYGAQLLEVRHVIWEAVLKMKEDQNKLKAIMEDTSAEANVSEEEKDE